MLCGISQASNAGAYQVYYPGETADASVWPSQEIELVATAAVKVISVCYCCEDST